MRRLRASKTRSTIFHPDHQARGIGRRLMDGVLGALRSRGAAQVTAFAREDRPRSIAFLTRNRFEEYARDFESRLDVSGVNLPLPEPATLDEFVTSLVQSPRALPDAFFLAKLRDFYIGLSMMMRSDGDPSLLRQELTGVLAPYRGLGIAMALKVRTIDYAQTRGYLRIRTFNSSKNDAMLAINARLGFVPRPAWIAFQKTLGPLP